MKLIAKILVLYLFVGSCFPKTDFSQLLRLAELAEHFSEHQAEALGNGNDVDWWTFFEMHFLHTEHDHQEGEDQHANLPFHSIDSSFVSNILCACPDTPSERGILASGNLPIYITTQVLPGYQPGIFHPPALA